MTIEEIRKKYGLKEANGIHPAGFVYCNRCPLDSDCLLSIQNKYCPMWDDGNTDGCNGLEPAWEAIQKYLDDPVAVQMNEVAQKESRIRRLLCDINPTEIASQIANDNLSQWCETIRAEILREVQK